MDCRVVVEAALQTPGHIGAIVLIALSDLRVPVMAIQTMYGKGGMSVGL
jgi:hypothetical protein